MIKVLHVLYSMNRGGIETLLMSLFRNIDRSKISFDFLLGTNDECDYNKEILALGGKIHYIPDCRNGVIRNIKMLNHFFKNHPEYKIVHVHASALLNIFPLLVAKYNKIPVRIIHSHNTWVCGNSLRNILHILNKMWVTDYATHYFACSKMAGEWMFSSKLKKVPYQIINNGIDVDKFKFDSDKRKIIRQRLSIENKFVIGHVGSFGAQKNHSFLLDIFKNIRDKCNSALLLLVGDGNLRGDIEAKIAKLGLNNSVILTGVRTDIPDLMCAMDVFAFPSLHEGLGIVAIESQCNGLKTIVADTIPEDAFITPLISKLPLELSAEKWAREIIKLEKGYARQDMSLEIKMAGYDIKKIAYKMQSFYCIEQNK